MKEGEDDRERLVEIGWNVIDGPFVEIVMGMICEKYALNLVDTECVFWWNHVFYDCSGRHTDLGMGAVMVIVTWRPDGLLLQS